MKFTFICIVIVLSCSVCDSYNPDIYSGLNFDFNKPKEQSRISNYDRDSYYPKSRYPFDNILPEDYEEPKLTEYEKIPDKIRQFQEVIDWERSQLHKHRPHHLAPELKYYLEKLSKPERFHLKIPGISRVEDRRFFQPDDDLAFRFNERKVEGIRDILDDPIFENNYENREDLIANKVEEIEDDNPHGHHEEHSNGPDTVEFTTNRFKNVQLAENPSEFAYTPNDPRFYRKVEGTTETITGTTIKRENTKLNTLENSPDKFDKLLVNPRSDIIRAEVPPKDNNIEVVPVQPNLTDVDSAGVYIIAIVAGISAAATVGLIAVGIGWYNLQKHVKNASDVEYPAYGVTGPNKDISPSGDRRLAQSAQMYHYQHQKQQIIAMERAPPGERHGSISEAESDEENEEGDYTVYECPGLAPTGEMEVKNPLFQDDPTPAQTPATKTSEEKK